MIFSIVITNDAKKDISQASDWYEEQKTRLGRKFMISLDNCFATILKNPLAFATYYGKIKKAKIEHFPYSIFYYTNEQNKIIVFAIVHNSRHENVWKKRI